MFGKINYPENDEENSYLTSEQVNMLMAADPKYKDKFEVARNMEDALDYNALAKESDAFDQRLPYDGATSKSLDIDGLPAANQISGSGVDGGFIQALLPFLPIIGQVLSPVIEGISSLFHKKGSGLDGDMPPVNASMLVREFVQENKDKLKEINDKIAMMPPKRAWKTLIEVGKDITQNVVSPIVGEKNAEQVANSIKFVPKGFMAILDKSKDLKSEGSGSMLTNVSLAEPVIKYALGKMGLRAEYTKYKPDLRGAGRVYGGKINWQKVRDWVKNALKGIANKALEVGAKKGTEMLSNPENIQKVGNIVSSLIDKFPLLSGSGFLKPPQRKGLGFMRPPNAGGKRPIDKLFEDKMHIIGGPDGIDPRLRKQYPSSSSGAKKKAPVGTFKVKLL